MNDCDWSSFSRFRNCAFGLWKVSMPDDATTEDWMVKGACTCPVYFKAYICKHLVALALTLELAKAPLAARNVPLGEKRKPGRPAHAVLALLHQPRESILEEEEDIFDDDYEADESRQLPDPVDAPAAELDDQSALPTPSARPLDPLLDQTSIRIEAAGPTLTHEAIPAIS